MKKAKKGDWVEIYQVLLEPHQRAPRIPQETKEVPLELKVKGWLDQDHAEIGKQAAIKTAVGRRLEGKLIQIDPPFPHNFGRPVPELLQIGPELRAVLRGEVDLA